MKLPIAVLAAFVVSSALLMPPAKADSTMAGKMPMPSTMHAKMAPAMSGPVYVCSKCKMYYSPKQAKMMKYKDPMGHSLKKMRSAPAGYKMGGMKSPAMKSDSKMKGM